jgi:hypothetical protein
VSGVRLLPAFDLSVVASPPGTPPLVAPALKPKIYRKSAWFTPVIVIDGRIAGIWKHEAKGKALNVELESFGKLAATRKREVLGEAERLAEFLGGALKASWR